MLGHRDDRRGHLNRAGWPESGVEIFVPLVAERVGGERERLVRRERRDGRVPPEAQARVDAWHRDRRRAAVDGEDLSGDGVLRASAVGRRAEARIAPRPGPRRVRIGLVVVVSFFVGDQRTVRRAVDDARLEARLPEHVVAGQEREVDARIARGLDGVALAVGPVLVVANREEHLRLGRAGERAAEAIGVDARLILDVVAVRLEPARHRVLGVEHEVRRAVAAALPARGERPVVARFVAANRRAEIEAVAAVLVVGLPRRVICLQHDVGWRRIVADDERDMARAAAVAREPRDVDARHRGRRHAPRRRHRPVAAVVQSGGRIGGARWLALARERRDRRHEACAVPLVVAEAVDPDRVGRRRRDLERDRAALVHADVGGESLNRAVARSGDVPLGARIPRQLVLGGNRIGRLRADAEAERMQGEQRGRQDQRSADGEMTTRVGTWRCHETPEQRDSGVGSKQPPHQPLRRAARGASRARNCR